MTRRGHPFNVGIIQMHERLARASPAHAPITCFWRRVHPSLRTHVSRHAQECAHTSSAPTPTLGACILGSSNPYLLSPAMIYCLQLLANHEHQSATTTPNKH